MSAQAPPVAYRRLRACWMGLPPGRPLSLEAVERHIIEACGLPAGDHATASAFRCELEGVGAVRVVRDPSGARRYVRGETFPDFEGEPQPGSQRYNALLADRQAEEAARRERLEALNRANAERLNAPVRELEERALARQIRAVVEELLVERGLIAGPASAGTSTEGPASGPHYGGEAA
ncbi:hypothetical protein [Conexibacter sp. DBS9H8]|uniref:hypothetical protein n=1 Tax=Conexibacter sp. DBS9H8 TaxID=2937801 RepID=UPI00200BA3D9|nr:hypothetical protein [Conexibacter sp. DBS9H8]